MSQACTEVPFSPLQHQRLHVLSEAACASTPAFALETAASVCVQPRIPARTHMRGRIWMHVLVRTAGETGKRIVTTHRPLNSAPSPSLSLPLLDARRLVAFSFLASTPFFTDTFVSASAVVFVASEVPSSLETESPSLELELSCPSSPVPQPD